MRGHGLARFAILGASALALAGCGAVSGLFGQSDEPGTTQPSDVRSAAAEERARRNLESTPLAEFEDRETIWDLFTSIDDPNTTVEVNKYIWNAALDILDFMPVEAADPFSGVLVLGYGVPPGSRQAYRATVYVQDPALDARSLRIALASRSGPAPIETVRAIEDAILTRARQLRLRDSDL